MFKNSGLTTITSSLFSESTECYSYEECFSGCRNLRTAGSVGNPITPSGHSVTVNISSMFENCSNLSTAEYAFGDVTNTSGVNSVIESGVLKYISSCTSAFSGCSNLVTQPVWRGAKAAGVPLPIGYMPSFYYLSKTFPIYDFGFPNVDNISKSGCFRGCTRMHSYAEFSKSYPEWF